MTNASKCSSGRGFAWTSERVELSARLCDVGVRRVLERRGVDDEFAAGELAAEAASKVWLFVGEASRDLAGCSGGEEAVLRLAAWKAVRATLDGRWLAGRVLDSKATRRVLGWRVRDRHGCGGGCEGEGGDESGGESGGADVCDGVAGGKYVSEARAESFRAAVVESCEMQLGGSGRVMARLVLDGVSVRECCERMGGKLWDVRGERRVVVETAERMAKVWGDWSEE